MKRYAWRTCLPAALRALPARYAANLRARNKHDNHYCCCKALMKPNSPQQLQQSWAKLKGAQDGFVHALRAAAVLQLPHQLREPERSLGGRVTRYLPRRKLVQLAHFRLAQASCTSARSASFWAKSSKGTPPASPCGSTSASSTLSSPRSCKEKSSKRTPTAPSSASSSGCTYTAAIHAPRESAKDPKGGMGRGWGAAAAAAGASASAPASISASAASLSVPRVGPGGLALAGPIGAKVPTQANSRGKNCIELGAVGMGVTLRALLAFWEAHAERKRDDSVHMEL